jgi:hypothetical protein
VRSGRWFACYEDPVSNPAFRERFPNADAGSSASSKADPAQARKNLGILDVGEAGGLIETLFR